MHRLDTNCMTLDMLSWHMHLFLCHCCIFLYYSSMKNASLICITSQYAPYPLYAHTILEHLNSVMFKLATCTYMYIHGSRTDQLRFERCRPILVHHSIASLFTSCTLYLYMHNNQIQYVYNLNTCAHSVCSQNTLRKIFCIGQVP